MSDPSDPTKPLRTRLAAQKTVLIVLGMIALTAGVGVVIASNEIIDDFNDGDLDGWVVGGNTSAQTSTVYEGSHAAEIPGDKTDSIQRDDLDYSYESITFFVNTNESGGSESALSGDITIPTNASYDVNPDIGSAPNIRLDGPNIPMDNETWYRVKVHNTDGPNVNVSVWNAETGVFVDKSWTGKVYSGNGNLIFKGNDADTFYVDKIFTGEEPDERIWGYVRDGDTGEELDNANVTIFNKTGSRIRPVYNTDEDGYYQFTVPNGTYKVRANKTGYFNVTKEVDVEGEWVRLDFELYNHSRAIEIKTQTCLEPGERSLYTVIFTNRTSDGQPKRTDVTDVSTVVSNNTTLLTVDQFNHEIVATNDTSLNGSTHISANYTGPNNVLYTQTKNVSIANKTVENLEQNDCAWVRTSSVISDGNIFVIILATIAGAAVSIIATVFAGLSAATAMMILGWVLGEVTDGMVIVAVLLGAWIGMNVAGQIDYQINRGGGSSSGSSTSRTRSRR